MEVLNNHGKEMKIKWKLGNNDTYTKSQAQPSPILSTSNCYSCLETLG